MRCRVSQNWAGQGWGGMVIPRIGMEVVVEFLEGDPDKPIVTGCVFNGRNDAPYKLPENKTKSVFRSRTHTGEGFNELSFEDEVGQENISLHAEKDQTLKVKNNRLKRIDNDQVESVGRNKSVEVGHNHQERIGGSMNLFVGGGKGSALAAGLAGLTALTNERSGNDAAKIRNPFVTSFIQATKEAGVAAEASSLLAGQTFDDAGGYRQVAGLEQVQKGSALSGLLSSVMPVSGIRNTIIEKAILDTVGILRTEQIGVYKNTVVGHTQTTHVKRHQRTTVEEERTVSVGKLESKEVGEHMTTTVGGSYQVTVGKSTFIMQADGTIILRGINIQIEGNNTIKAVSELIDLN